MNPDEKKQLIHFYDSRYEEFGYDVKSVGWGDRASQELRFRVLSDIADLSGSSVCDLGCGFGDLYPYLMKRFGRIAYTGIDISRKLIEEATRRHPEVSFEARDILENPAEQKYDYVLASGALSFKVQNHEQYVRNMLTAMMAMSTKGVAVNFLSSYVDYSLDKNFHFSPEHAFTLGRSLTPFLSLRHDYPLYEFTMYLFHTPLSNG